MESPTKVTKPLPHWLGRLLMSLMYSPCCVMVLQSVLATMLRISSG